MVYKYEWRPGAQPASHVRGSMQKFPKQPAIYSDMIPDSSRLAGIKYCGNMITHPEVTPVFNCWKAHVRSQKYHRIIAQEDAEKAAKLKQAHF